MINEVVGEVLARKSIIDRAKIEFIPVNLGRKEVNLPNIIPVDIFFSREMEFVEIEKMVGNMISEDFNFEIFDMLLIQGSVHLSGTIYDKNKNVTFNITCNSDRLTLTLRKHTDFDSMLFFYRMVTERLDLNASLDVPAITNKL